MAAAKKFGVIFACVGNSARSQMAEGFAKAFARADVIVRSGGNKPLGHVLPEAIQVMREKGIDTSKNASKGFDEDPVRRECDGPDSRRRVRGLQPHTGAPPRVQVRR